MAFAEYVPIFRCADSSFGINKQALAMLAYLSAVEVEGCHLPDGMETFPMRLQGKTGVSLLFEREDHPMLLIFFGESPDDPKTGLREDLIVKTVQAQNLVHPEIGPTHLDFEKKGSTEFFNECDIVGAYNHIVAALLTYMM